MLDIEDQAENQARTGAPAEQGCTTADFARFCQDIIEQPGWRASADRCADYYDGNQLSADAIAALRDNGMDAIIANLVKPTVNVALGMEARTRTDWRVSADSDDGNEVAEALSARLMEVERETRANRACADAYAGQIKAGLHWVEVSRNSDPFLYPHRVEAIHRREIFWDWRARQSDTLDGRYLIRKRWFDVDEVAAMFPGKADLIRRAGNATGPWYVELEHLHESTRLSHSLDQAMRVSLAELEWRDITRRRICLYETWYRRVRHGYILKLPDGRAVELDMRNPAHQLAVARGYLAPQQAVYSQWGMALWMGPNRIDDYGVSLRSFQQQAWERKSYGSKNPLFMGEVGMWNGILVKKMTDFWVQFNPADTVTYNASTDTAGQEGSTATIPSLSGTFHVERCILLGAQALANCRGRSQSSDFYYSWLERKYNFGRATEVAVESMGGKSKVRFNVPDATGTRQATDHGVMVVDVAVKN